MPVGAALVARVLEEAVNAIKGQAVDPAKIGAKLARHFRLIATNGVVGLALSGIDVACWDAMAIAAGEPLGGIPRGKPPASFPHQSHGGRLLPPAELPDAAAEVLQGGVPAPPLCLGQ